MTIQNVYAPIMAGGKIAGNIGGVGQSRESLPFSAVFRDAVANVEHLDAVKSSDSYRLAVGDIDDVAEMMVHSEQAQVAFQLFVQMRNKVLDSYSEIMRMNI